MPDSELTRRVLDVVARTQKLPRESLTLDKTFEELKIDSFDGINILFALESEFNIEIPDDSLDKVRLIREMAEGVEKLIAAKAGANP